MKVDGGIHFVDGEGQEFQGMNPSQAFQAGLEQGRREVVEWIEAHQIIEPKKDSLTRFEPFYQIEKRELKGMVRKGR